MQDLFQFVLLNQMVWFTYNVSRNDLCEEVKNHAWNINRDQLFLDQKGKNVWKILSISIINFDNICYKDRENISL